MVLLMGDSITQTAKKGHWFLVLTKMVLWILAMIMTFIGFFQILPLLLLTFGNVTLLLGSSSQAPTIIDIALFIPVAISMSGLLTYFLYGILKKENKQARRHQKDLMKRMIDRKKN